MKGWDNMTITELHYQRKRTKEHLNEIWFKSGNRVKINGSDSFHKSKHLFNQIKKLDILIKQRSKTE